jgi:arabinose-5-phosphate isomerase
MEAVSSLHSQSRFEQLRLAREIVRAEGDALLALASRLPDRFCDAIDLLAGCRGRVVVTGMGKAGLIGQKIVATFSSTGTSSHFLHPAEAVHGDLGCIQSQDVILALSYSGETEEIVRLLPAFRGQQSPLIAVTANERSSLGRSATVTLALGQLREACPLGLAPTTSTTVMLALGDALALVLSRLRQFTAHDFARFHPGGNLGRKLARVDEVMRTLRDCRTANQDQTVRDVLVTASKPGRRTGAIMLVGDDGGLTGVFTDSDLARLLESRNEGALDQPIRSVMTRAPTTIVAGSPMSTAVELLAQKRISELPVVDDQGKPVGLIDITDVVAWLPPPIGTSPPQPHSEYSRSTVPFPNHFQGPSRT